MITDSLLLAWPGSCLAPHDDFGDFNANYIIREGPNMLLNLTTLAILTKLAKFRQYTFASLSINVVQALYKRESSMYFPGCKSLIYAFLFVKALTRVEGKAVYTLLVLKACYLSGTESNVFLPLF